MFVDHCEYTLIIRVYHTVMGIVIDTVCLLGMLSLYSIHFFISPNKNSTNSNPCLIRVDTNVDRHHTSDKLVCTGIQHQSNK